MDHSGHMIGLLMLAGVCLCADAVGANEPDLRTWQTLPVFDQRITSLDTFARSVVETICGSSRPVLSPAGAELRGQSPPARALRQVFPDDRPRRFSAAELLLAWLVEPEVWQYVPFLPAEDEQLRRKVLQLPVYDAQGHRLRHVSPWQLSNNEGFFEHWDQLRRLADEQEDFKPDATQRELQRLVEAYDAYRRLTFDPAGSDQARVRFMVRFRDTRQAWAQLVRALQAAGRLSRDDQSARLVIAVGEALDRVSQLFRAPEFQLDQMDRAVAEMHRQAAAVQRHLIASGEPNKWVLLAREMQRQAAEAHMALYDNGLALRLVPSLSLSALEANRTPDDDAHPWLSFQALIHGSDALLAEYPQEELAQVRAAFERVRAAWRDHEAADRSARLGAALDEFSAGLRRLGEKIEPIRRRLPLVHRDEQILDATAYPPPGKTDVEVLYNRLDPFFWSWPLNLAAVVFLVLSLVVWRRPMFGLGLLALAAGQAMVLTGLALRWKITGLVPLTGMFETVVFMGLSTAVLGIGFVFSPLLRTGWQAGWRLCSLRGRHKARRPEENPVWASAAWEKARWGLVPVRVAITAWLAWYLVRIPYLGEHGYFELWPRVPVGALLPSGGNVLIWAAGWCVLLLILYLVPRGAVALIVALSTAPVMFTRQHAGRLMEEVSARRIFALVGAAVALGAALLACYAPETILSRSLESPRPILRHNFWLLVHVLTITASYAAGALAWGLGNVAMGFYLLGRYRPADSDSAREEGSETEYFGAGEAQSETPQAQGNRLETKPARRVRPLQHETDEAPVEAMLVRDAGRQAQATAPQSATEPASRGPTPPAAAGPPSNRHSDSKEHSGSALAPEACRRLAGYTYRALQIAVLLLAAGTILGAMWGDVAWGRFWGWDPKEVWALVTLLVYMVILHGRHIGWVGQFGVALAAVAGFGAIVMAWYGVNFVLGSGLHAYASGAGGQVWVLAAALANLLLVLGAAVRYLAARHG